MTISSLNTTAKLVVVFLFILLSIPVFSQVCTGSFSVDRNVTDVLCPGESDGAIDINIISGGVPPYSFSWSNGETTEDITDLESGSYSVTVSDFLNTCDTFHFEVNAPPYYNEFDKIVAEDRSPDDWFGYAVAISGDYALVGAHQEDDDTAGNNNLNSAGSAYFFKKDINGVWNYLQKVVAPDRQVGDQFGYAVDLFGEYAIVGALLQDHDASGGNFLNESGAAYVYKLNTDGQWQFIQKLVASDRGELDRFSNSVAITDDFALVGSFREDEDASGGATKNGAGSVYIYKRDSTNTYSEVQKIVADDRGPGDQFGWSVAVSNEDILVGARLEDHDLNGVNVKTNSGSAYVFGKDSTGSWVQKQKLIASDRGVVDYFGHSVSISDNYLLIGAVLDDDDENGMNQLSNAGSAYFFRKDSSGMWMEIQKSVPSDRDVDDQFGNTLDISGEFAIIGAWREEDSSIVNNSGSAYVYQLMNDGSWKELQKLTASDREETDQFGISVSISGDFAVVGANLEDHDRDGINTQLNAGSAYIFGPTIALTAKITNVACNETNNGSIDLVARGGALPLSFLWSTGDTTEDIGGLAIGSYNVIATDTNGCSATATFYVDLKEDDTPPEITCPSNIITETDSGCYAFVDYEDAMAIDDCGIKSVEKASGPDTGYLAIGTYTVKFIAEDSVGFKDSCEFMIMISDIEKPVAVCPDSIPDLILDASGKAQLPANLGTGNSTDNCFVVETSELQLYDCNSLGAQSVNLVVADSSGNSDTAVCAFVIKDTSKPTAVCPASIVQVFLDENGQAFLPADIGDSSSSDNCNVTETSPAMTFGCIDLGTASVVLTASDNSGNSSSITCSVNVVDTSSPQAICPDSAIILLLDSNGEATLIANSVTGKSMDNCSLSESNPAKAFNCSDIGQDDYILKATDNSGNLDSVSCEILIVDLISPEAKCKDLQLALDSFGSAMISASQIDNGSSDQCGILSRVVDKNTFSCSELGFNQVILSVTDSSGNSDTCHSIVLILDTIIPVAICRDSTIYIDSSGEVSLSVAEVDGGSYDACLDSLFLDESFFSCEEGGQKQITLTAIDKSGNFSSCISQITILDTINPIAKCKDTIVAYLNNMNVVKIPPSTFDAGSFDNCDLDKSANKTIFTCLDVGFNNVRLVVTDPQGKSDSCAGILEIRENFKPIALCKNSVTLALDSFGIANVLPSDLDKGSGDNCAVQSMVVNIPVLNCVSNVVTLTVTDEAGNSSSCSSTVYTIDTLGPSAKCNDVNIVLGNNFFESISVAMIDNGSFDGCGIDSISLSQMIFGCVDAGINSEVMTVTDLQGNTAQCDFTVNVSIAEAPRAVCKDATVMLDSSGNQTLTPAEVDSGSSAGICGFNLSVVPSSFSCGDQGSQTVILTVKDAASGAEDTCHAQIVVIDNIKPVMNCPGDTLILDTSGLAVLDKSTLASDACGLQILASQDSFYCVDTGTQSVFALASDSIGNFSFCTFDVLVLDPDSACAPELCLIPVNLVSSASYTSATLTWDPVPGASNYIVEGAVQGSNSTVQLAVEGNSITVTGLTPGTTYVWHVKTVCPENSSDYSDVVSFMTLSCSPPTNLFTSNIQKKKARLNWTVNPMAVGYRIFGGQNGQLNISLKVPNGSKNFFNLTGLAAGTTYNWAIQSVCSLNPFVASSLSPISVFTTSADHTSKRGEGIEIFVFPNPNTGKFNIRISQDFTGTLEVFDVTQRRIHIEKVNSSNEISVDLSAVSEGVYLLRMTNPDHTYIQQILIQK